MIPFLDDGHWALVIVEKAGSTHATVGLYDGIPGRCTEAFRAIMTVLQSILPQTHLGTREVAFWRQVDEHSCGAFVLAHAAAVLFHDQGSSVLAQAQAFVAQFPRLRTALLGAGGLSEVQEGQLAQILTEHGVQQAAVGERIKQAVSKLGAGVLAQALQGKNVWQLLKAAANKPGLNFRWVSVEELQQHIATRTERKFGTQVPRAKAKKAKLPTQAKQQLQVDPAQLLLASGSFVSSSGAPLGQLSFAEVQSQATGVCFCSLQQASPFLRDGKNLSVDALALLITAPVAVEEWGSARISPFRFPALYAPTKEAILVSGAILQLGDDDVQPAVSCIEDVEVVDTVACRISLFKDETRVPWDSVIEAPVRAMLQHITELQVCKDFKCDGSCSLFQPCSLFHPAVEESLTQLFQDVWARSYSRVGGGKVRAVDSELFQTFVRIPSSALSHLFKIQANGFYVEPRAPDGSPHGSWAVVWLPGAGLAEASHALNTVGSLKIRRIARYIVDISSL